MNKSHQDPSSVVHLMPRHDGYIEQAVINFAAWHSGAGKDEIKSDTLLVQDLGIDGPEAIEFINSFSLKYDVDIRNFPHDEYFHKRSRRFSFLRLLLRGQGIRPHDLKDLRISDLIRAAKQKVLPAA